MNALANGLFGATLLAGLTPDPQFRESAWGWCLDVAAKRVASILRGAQKEADSGSGADDCSDAQKYHGVRVFFPVNQQYFTLSSLCNNVPVNPRKYVK